MAYVTKADLLAGLKLQPVDHEVEGLGTVQVRGLSLNQLDEIDTKAGGRSMQMMLLGAYYGLVNPQLSVEDLAVLGEGDPAIVTSIGKRVFALSARGVTEEIDPLAGNGS